MTEDDVRSTSMGAGGEDVLMSTAARKQWPVSIECKRKAKFAGYTLMDQAEANCPKGAQPIVVVRGDRKKAMVLVDAEYFFDLLKGK